MNIIRDGELVGVGMLALLVSWGIKRCNQKDCTEKPTTIITGIKNTPAFGLCEQHFQGCNIPGGASLNLVWDKFDAFAEKPIRATERN